MNEWKRVLLSRSAAALAALLALLNVFFQIAENPYAPGFAGSYAAELERYDALEPAQAASEVEQSLEEVNQEVLLHLWHNEDTGPLRDALEEQCRQNYGGGFESAVAAMDFSEAEYQELLLRQSALQVIREQLDYLTAYPDYLDTVHSNARQMAGLKIFSHADSFSQRNIARTDEVFPDSGEIALSLDRDVALSHFVEDALPSYSLFVWMLAVVLRLLQERKSGLWSLIHGGARGRIRLGVRRVFLLLGAALIGTVLILGSTLLTASALYGGLGDLGRSVQSCRLFQAFPEQMPVGTFLLLYAAVKVLGIWLVGLILWALLQSPGHLPLALTGAAVFLTAEFALFTFLPDSYTLAVLRYVNVFALIDTAPVLLTYLNLNLFGWPVRGSSLTLALVPVLAALFGAVCVLLQAKKKPVAKQNRMIALIQRCQIPFSRMSSRLGLLGSELRKVFWSQKGLVVLAALLLWLGWGMSTPPADIELYDTALAAVAADYEGPVTEETLSAIDRSLEELRGWADSTLVNQQTAALEALREIAEDSLSAGDGRWLMNPAPYLAIMNQNQNNDQRINALVSMLAILLLAAGIFPYERQQQILALLQASPCGRRRLWRCKTGMALGLTGMLWLLTTLRTLWLTVERYGSLSTLEAPLRSLEYFWDAPAPLSVGMGLALYFLLRLTAMLAFTCAVLGLSCVGKTVNQSILLCCAVLLLPVCLEVMGFPFIGRLSFARVFSPLEASWTDYAPALLLGVGGGIYSFLSWQRRTVP